jgi:hypothetical protein
MQVSAYFSWQFQPELHLDVSTVYTTEACAAPGRAYTTEACAAPGRVYITEA